jgi:hypothetical protein
VASQACMAAPRHTSQAALLTHTPLCSLYVGHLTGSGPAHRFLWCRPVGWPCQQPHLTTTLHLVTTPWTSGSLWNLALVWWCILTSPKDAPEPQWKEHPAPRAQTWRMLRAPEAPASLRVASLQMNARTPRYSPLVLTWAMHMTVGISLHERLRTYGARLQPKPPSIQLCNSTC